MTTKNFTKKSTRDSYGSNYYKVITVNGDEPIAYEDTYRGLSEKDYWNETKVAGKGWNYGILSFEGEELLPPVFSKISEYDHNTNLAKVYFSDGSFFYINTKAECVEHNETTCPE